MDQKKYWQSFAERTGSEELKKASQDEFKDELVVEDGGEIICFYFDRAAVAHFSKYGDGISARNISGGIVVGYSRDHVLRFVHVGNSFSNRGFATGC